MKRTFLAVVGLVFAVGLTWAAENAQKDQNAAQQDDQAAAKPEQPTLVASNKLPGQIAIPPQTDDGNCPEVPGGNSCPATACVDPNGGPGEVCHKTGCASVNTGRHGCFDGENFFTCGPTKTIWVDTCYCQCLGESCGSYGSWVCR